MTATLLLSITAGACLLVTAAIWRVLRATTRRLDELAQSYWQLKYELGELRVQMEGRGRSSGAAHAPPQPAPPGGEAFIPLTSLKR
jgi:hypothetical protein